MESKTQGRLWSFQEPSVCKHLEPKMQTLTSMDKIVIEDYYHMATMDETMKHLPPPPPPQPLGHYIVTCVYSNLGEVF